MKSTDSMLNRNELTRRPTRAGLALGVWLGLLSGCAGSSITREPKLTPPEVVTAPYDQSHGEVLFAVIPFRNETGVSQLDNLVFSDKVVAALEEVKGIRCVPINRTLETMRSLKITQVTTPAQARQVAQAMGVDGILVGSLTAWEPYEPTIGLTVLLQAKSGALSRGAPPADPGVDSRALSRMATETATVAASNFGNDAPTNVFSDNLNGKDHRVLVEVQRFAQGRHDPTAAMGWQRYVKSMDLYQAFAAHYAVERLMESEKVRLGVTAPVENGVSGRVSKTGNRPAS